LLEFYGFCLPPGAGPSENPHETAALPPELLGPTCRRDPPRAADCWLHWDGRPGWGLLRALRVGAATPEERRLRGHLALEGRPVAAAGDAACAAGVRAACAARLAALPTGVEEDEAELERLKWKRARLLAGSPSLGAEGGGGGGRGGGGGGGAPLDDLDCMQLAVAWRIGYKRMLHRGMHLDAPP
jgi:hypothetical protein